MTDALDWGDRFWSRVHPEALSECWLWHGAMRSNGYGVAYNGRRGKPKPAHRVAYELVIGPIPDGMDLCHRCDVRACVNPDHLFPGTRKENMQDAVRKGRTCRGERRSAISRKGTANNKAKLSPELVSDIRRRCANGERQRAIAAMYGVSQYAVFAIHNRRTWSHLP